MNGIDEFLKAVRNAKPQKLAVIEYRAYYKGTKIISATSGPQGGDWPTGEGNRQAGGTLPGGAQP